MWYHPGRRTRSAAILDSLRWWYSLCISLLKTTWHLTSLNLSIYWTYRLSAYDSKKALSPASLIFFEADMTIISWNPIFVTKRQGLAPTLRQCFAVLVSSFARRRLLLVELLRNFVQRRHLKLILEFLHTQSFLEWLNIWPLSIVFIACEDWNRTWLCSSTSKCWDDVRIYLNGYANTISGFRQLLFFCLVLGTVSTFLSSCKI